MLTLLVLLSGFMPVNAQRRQLSDARTILKSGKNIEKAEKLMTDLLKDSANQSNPRIYDLWLQSVELQYDEQNKKMYKREQIDTTKLFTLVRRIFTIAERLDSIDMQPNKKGQVSLAYRQANSQRLSGYRPNLFFGGAYHLRRGDFTTAFDFFETYIDCTRQPLFSGMNIAGNDARLTEASYWSSYCGFRLGNPILTLRYSEQACQDSVKREYALQYAAEAWNSLSDDSMYVDMLWKGFRDFPVSNYFFPRLMDYYTRKGNQEKALDITTMALEADSLNELFLYARSTALLNMSRHAESLICSRKLIALNSQHADAYYNAGTACLNIILNMDSRRHKKQIRKMYQDARYYMETYRSLSPQAKDKWGPALYRIYFNLNLGKQFDEIDKILKK